MIGQQVTLSNSGTTYQLYALLKAINPALVPYGQQVNVQSDPGNGAANLFIGGANLSSTVYGLKLPASGSMNFQSPTNSVQLDSIYLLTDTNGTTVNILANIV